MPRKSNVASSDHSPLVQDAFRGLYTRGFSDTAPPGFFLDSRNNRFAESDVLTRNGTALNFTLASIIRIFVYKRLNETPRFIILTNDGNLWDSLFGSPIFSDVSYSDFSALNYNNRCYISPHNRVSGISGKSVLVYDGSGTARLAAGPAPSGFTLGAVESVSSGHCEAGIHLFAIAGLTKSGYITAPGPAIFAKLTCTGGLSVNLSALPNLGSNYNDVVILATKAIPATLYNNNQFGYEFFFVPGALIPIGTATATVSFFDADLINSADYLFDNLSTIPAGLGLISYNGRLGVWGEQANQHTIRLSNSGDPETFDATSGFITVDPSEAISGIKNCFEYRKSLIICKSNRIYGTTDNASSPNTWSVDMVDKSVGTECFGVATVLDARGVNNDRAFIASVPGLVSYEGLVKKPELSWNIEDTWKRINKACFNQVQVVDDPVNHQLFVLVPLDSAIAPSHILYADYSQSHTIYGFLDEKKLKWDVWTFPTVPVSIAGDYNATTFQPVLHIALSGGNIYDMKDNLIDDFSNAIQSYFKTDLKALLPGWLHHFGGIKLRAKGAGNLLIDLYGEDDAGHVSIPSISLALSPGLEPDRLINFINEKMSIKFSVTNFQEYYVITRLDVWAKALWLRRPS